MRCLKVTLVLCLSALWLAGPVGVALSVSLPFYDDFENVAVGSYPSANGWRTWSAGYTAHVANQVYYSPTHSFLLRTRSTLSRCDYLPLSEVPERLAYQVALFMDPMPGRKAYAGLAYLARTGATFCDYFTAVNQNGTVGSVYFTGASDLPAVWVGDFPVREWVTVGAVLDYRAGVASLWFNGQQVASGVPIAPRRELPGAVPLMPNAFAAAEATWPGSGWGVIHVDDVALFEPVREVTATVDLQPNTLKLSSRGRWVTCYVELPDDYSVTDIEIDSLTLNGVLPAEPHPTAIGDYDGDGIEDLMVKFDRAALCDLLEPGIQTVELTGRLADGTVLVGSDQIRALR